MSEPKMVGLGVIAALIERDGKFLLMKEVQRHIPNHPDDGKWNLPGGRLEVGENPTEAIQREVLEETGFSFIPTHILGLYSIVRKDIEPELGALIHVQKVIFLGTIFEKPERDISSDSGGVRWFTAKEIQAMDRFMLRNHDIKIMVKQYEAGIRYPLSLLTHTISPRS